MPFVPDDPKKKHGFKPDAKDKSDDEAGFRLGPTASAFVRPIAKGIASAISPFPGPTSLPDKSGKPIPIKSHAEEFEDFLDRYTTKPTSKLGKVLEGGGEIIAGGVVPIGRLGKVGEVAGEAAEAAGRGVAKGVEALTGKGAALREATRWGLKVAPEDMEHPNLIGRVTSYIGGRSIGRGISRHNAERFNELGANSLGLPSGTPLTEKAGTFETVRDNAGKAYERLRNGPGVDGKTILDDVIKLGSQITDLEKEMPGVVNKDVLNELARIKGSLLQDKFSPGVLLDAIKFWRADAGKHFKSNDPRSWYTAVFERQAADVAEGALEKAAAAAGDPALVSDVRNARKLIARSYLVEDSTNTVTGNLNAELMARLSKDRFVDGELKAIVDFAKAHRHSAQSVDRIGSIEAQSKLRFFLAAGAFLAGHPGYAAALAGEAGATAIGTSRLTQTGARAAQKGGGRGLDVAGMGVVGAQQAAGAVSEQN